MPELPKWCAIPRLEQLLRSHALLLMPLGGGILMCVSEAQLLEKALNQPGKQVSSLAGTALGCGIAVGGAVALVALWELIRFFRKPPSAYPSIPPEGDRVPDFTGARSFGLVLRVSTAVAAGKAHVLSGLLSALGMLVFGCTLLVAGEGEGPGLEAPVILGLLVIAMLAFARGGRHKLRTRVWVFQNGLACRAGGEFTALKWDEIKWLVTTVGAAGLPEDRRTGLGTRDGRSIWLPAELDDPDATPEFVVEMAHQNMYPRLLSAMDRGLEVDLGDVWLCSRGIRRRENEDVILWASIGQIEFLWGTHVVVMKRDMPVAWLQLPVRTTENVWLFLWLTRVLHPLQTAPPTLDRPWLRRKAERASSSEPDA